MNRFAYGIVTVVLIAAIGGTVWYFAINGSQGQEAAAQAAQEPYVVPPLENEYKNEEFRFALSMPEGFTAGELPAEDGAGKAIVLQDARGNGVQILITSFPSDPHELTAAQIQRDIPDMRITDVQPVEIGEDYTGVAFKSDSAAFDGGSREVWFVFHGNLYQISTYARLDPLLQGIFATWRFY